MDYDINKYLLTLITESPSIDIAEAEFKRNLADDDDLKTAYRQWCEEKGYSERKGFAEFCQEYFEDRDELWNSLDDYDDEQ